MTSSNRRSPQPTPRPEADRSALARWLAAESAGRDAEAEKALATLFLRLDRLEPKPGFAERVLGELGVPRVPSTVTGSVAGSAGRWRRRLVLGVAALVPLWVLVGAMAPSLLAPAWRLVSVAEILDGIGRGLDWTARGLTGLGELWSTFSGVGQAVATATGTLPLAALLLAGLVVAGLALRALSDLMARERSWSHVHFGT